MLYNIYIALYNTLLRSLIGMHRFHYSRYHTALEWCIPIITRQEGILYKKVYINQNHLYRLWSSALIRKLLVSWDQLPLINTDQFDKKSIQKKKRKKIVYCIQMSFGSIEKIKLSRTGLAQSGWFATLDYPRFSINNQVLF